MLAALRLSPARESRVAVQAIAESEVIAAKMSRLVPLRTREDNVHRR
jgi:hypothetical protein